MLIKNDSLEVLRTCLYVPNKELGCLVSDNLYLSIVATNACQMNCPYCINSLTDKTLEMPFKKATENISKAIAKFGIKEAVILGGEPTLYKNLVQLIHFLKDAGLRKVGFTTNGIRLTDEKYLIELAKSGVDFINVSYHNSDFISYNDLMRIYNVFKENTTPYQKLRINTNVWRGNHDKINTLISFLSSIRYYCDEIRVSNIIRKDGFSVNPNAVDEAESMYMSDEEYEILFTQLLKNFEYDYSIIHNPLALGFVNYYLIPTPTPIILNWNIDSKVSEQVCENNLAEKKIHTIKCLVTGDISLSWNLGNKINFDRKDS